MLPPSSVHRVDSGPCHSPLDRLRVIWCWPGAMAAGGKGFPVGLVVMHSAPLRRPCSVVQCCGVRSVRGTGAREASSRAPASPPRRWPGRLPLLLRWRFAPARAPAPRSSGAAFFYEALPHRRRSRPGLDGPRSRAAERGRPVVAVLGQRRVPLPGAPPTPWSALAPAPRVDPPPLGAGRVQGQAPHPGSPPRDCSRYSGCCWAAPSGRSSGGAWSRRRAPGPASGRHRVTPAPPQIRRGAALGA